MNFTRNLRIIRSNPPLDTEVPLTIHSISKHATKEKYVCVWSIPYLCSRGVAYGEDEIEALINGMRVISLFISGSEKDGIRIWWKSPGDNGGFPVFVNEPGKGN